MYPKPAIHLSMLCLRLVFGGVMVVAHGWPKAVKWCCGDRSDFADPLGTGPVVALTLAVFAELVCGTLLTLGLFTRWALVPLILTMLVAILIVHGGDPFFKWEKALLYLAAYLAIFVAGPGRYALDARIFQQQ